MGIEYLGPLRDFGTQCLNATTLSEVPTFGCVHMHQKHSEEEEKVTHSLGCFQVSRCLAHVDEMLGD